MAMTMITQKVEALFSAEGLRYKVPRYQRHYVWDKRNWGHLWDDIEEKVEEVSKQQKDGGEGLLPHFTGVIVIHTQNQVLGQGQVPEIVDGQQRLTTFQIIFCVIRDLSRAGGDMDTAKYAEGLILDGSSGLRHSKLLLTTGVDQTAFHQLSVGNVAESSGLIREAYEYFKEAIGDYAARGGDISHLLSVFLDLFTVVEILLDANDPGAKVFESINGRGLSLTQFDHLRNNVFLRAEEDRDLLYDTYWQHFNTEGYWLSNRAVDPFLEDFLKAKLGKNFNKDGPLEHDNWDVDKVHFNKDRLSLFDLYQRDYCRELKTNMGDHEEERGLVWREFEELQRYSRVYTDIITSDWGNHLWFYNYLRTNFENRKWHPFILALESEKDDIGISDEDLELTFHILESYIVRRMLCYGPAQAAPRPEDFVLDLISQIIRGQNGFSVGNLVRHLGNHSWPTDEAVKKSLSKAGTRSGRIVRYILFKIEDRMRSDRGDGAQPDFGTDLTLEHVMPREWRRNQTGWPIPGGEGEYYRRADTRDRCLESIGNLTLLSPDLNYQVGNRSFEVKKSLYNTHASLRITRELLRYDNWAVDDIDERERRFSALFFTIWRSNADFLRVIGEEDIEPTEIEAIDQVHQGVVEQFIRPRGFGFITPDTDLPDCSEGGVFVHVNDFPEARHIASWDPPRRVQFRITKDDDQSYIRACEVSCI